MKHRTALAVLFGTSPLLGAAPGHGDTPLLALTRKLTAVIRSHCPAAKIETDQGAFTAKDKTTVYSVRRQYKTGRYSMQTFRDEGPSRAGFLLRVRVLPGRYDGQATVPQELHGPHFRTYINDQATKDGRSYFNISFSYGEGLDPALKKAILGALP